MMTITKIEGIDDLTKKLQGLPRVVEKATISALNEIGSQAATQSKKEITKEYRLKLKDLKEYIFLTKAKKGQQFVTITGRGKPIPLYNFDIRSKATIKKTAFGKGVPSQEGVPVKKRKPVYVKIKRQGPKKKVNHAFFAWLRKKNHVGIFVRSKDGNPKHIHELFTTGPYIMFKRVGIKAIENIVKKKGRRIFQHELDFHLLKEAGMLPAKGKR